MAGFYEVANWREYQHYKDRNPPWIKLHFALLSSETWVSLDDASRVLAVACMLLASRNEGRVPADPAYIKRVAYLSDLPNFKPLINSGFLLDASGLLADASTMQADARPEKRREETEERQKQTRPRAVAGSIEDRFAQFWAVVTKKVGKAQTLVEFRKVSPDDETLARMIASMRVYAQKEIQFQKDPERWVKYRRWEDEAPAGTPGGPPKPRPKTDMERALERMAREAVDE